MTIIEQLAKLAEVAPDMCQHIGSWYYIGQYRFTFDGDALEGCYDANPAVFRSAEGRPALDWLQCALQRVIEARGWYWSAEVWSDGVSSVKIWKTPIAINCGANGNPLTEALLGALIKAVAE